MADEAFAVIGHTVPVIVNAEVQRHRGTDFPGVLEKPIELVAVDIAILEFDSVGVALKTYIAKYAPGVDALGDLNLTRLDGAKITPDDLVRTVRDDHYRYVVFVGLERLSSAVEIEANPALGCV